MLLLLTTGAAKLLLTGAAALDDPEADAADPPWDVFGCEQFLHCRGLKALASKLPQPPLLAPDPDTGLDSAGFEATGAGVLTAAAGTTGAGVATAGAAACPAFGALNRLPLADGVDAAVAAGVAAEAAGLDCAGSMLFVPGLIDGVAAAAPAPGAWSASGF